MHFLDCLAIWAWCSLVRRNLGECLFEAFHHPFHRRGTSLSRLAPWLRRRSRFRPGQVPAFPTRGPAFNTRVFCCSKAEFELPVHSFDRPRLPSPLALDTSGWDPVSRAFRYYAVLRLLLGRWLSSFHSTAYRLAEPSRPHWVRTGDFVTVPSPIRLWHQRKLG